MDMDLAFNINPINKEIHFLIHNLLIEQVMDMDLAFSIYPFNIYYLFTNSQFTNSLFSLRFQC